jgi:hypothetical protein
MPRCGNPNHGLQYLRKRGGSKWRKSPIGVGRRPTRRQSDGYYNASSLRRARNGAPIR